jgi:hypothetical protein
MSTNFRALEGRLPSWAAKTAWSPRIAIGRSSTNQALQYASSRTYAGEWNALSLIKYQGNSARYGLATAEAPAAVLRPQVRGLLDALKL